MLRSEARSYIDFYERMPGHHPGLLRLAKQDFNNVQSLYQAEINEMLRWWRGLELAENLKFSRDRLMENYGLTKLNCLITTIDDVYDVYGTIDELELFTEAVVRWDIGYIDKLPQYMRMCFLALYNTTNQFVYEFMRDKGLNIIGYLTRAWADLCKAYLVEARWFYNGYAPTVEEYLENAWVSISGPVILVHAYFFVEHDMKEDAVVDLHHFSNLIKMSSRILRLHDDVATSKDEIQRGDVPKCIQCYMREKGVLEEAARQYVEGLLRNSWKELHKECTEATSNGTSHPLVHCALNLARMAQFMYQHGDGHGFPGRDYPAERILRLMVESKLISDFHVCISISTLSLPVQRRSGNYPPSRWTDDLILSLKSTHERSRQDDHGSEKIEEIKQNVRQMLEGRDEPVAQMELVDDLQRLGVSYHFEKEIKVVMDCIFEDRKECEDLYFTALRFRLLRQHGYHASPDVFKVFVDERGRYSNILAEDLKGLLNLYEASHLRFEGEDILKEAMDFTTHHLRESITKMNDSDCTLARQIAQALELPLSRRMLRSEARNYIDLYERRPGHRSCLLKLAKLNFL
ncbi:hypothetical protein EJ110_NYTH54240 [Nymphaea thermarum]|nr:hypothetical protein EJ110_NYTH54240 [Nymphaea thermarum]